jgi:hypothetical protein
MDRFAVNESRMLYFHRVLIDQARRSPGLIARARPALAGMRLRAPALATLWDQWEGLLAAGLDAIEQALLADGAQAGLLRANSPLAEILEAEERNALWQRVGLQQFAAYYLGAVQDLGLSLDEEAAITTLDVTELESWSEAPPLSMTQAALDALKMVIAIQRALTALFPEQDMRQAWLRGHVDSFAARPIDMLVGGGGDLVQSYLAAAVQPNLDRETLPSY